MEINEFSSQQTELTFSGGHLSSPVITNIEFKTEINQAPVQSIATTICGESQFPTEVFPAIFYDLIVDCKGALNFPTDYTGTAILSAVATTIGKTAKAKVKRGWYELPAFYFAIVGNAGAVKSHPLEMSYKPLAEIDAGMIKSYSQNYSLYEESVAINKRQRVNMQLVPKPTLEKIILHNFTPEILHKRLADNPRGCAIVSEEMATWMEGMNSYSKGDQSSTYLSFWSNKSTSIDRVSTPIPLMLHEPFLNIIGSLQPRILPKLFPVGKTDSGFLQRFLFAFPENAGKQPINDIEISENLLQRYSTWIENYISATPFHTGEDIHISNQKIYNLSSDAKEFFYDWQKNNTEIVNQSPDGLKAEIMNKFDIHFIRLSLVLQIMENHDANTISLLAVKGAAKLCSYYKKTAMKVLKILENPGHFNALQKNKETLYNALPEDFTTAEANNIGESLHFNIKAVQRFLDSPNLFEKVSHGKYSKKTVT